MSDQEINSFPKKRIYKRRSSVQNRPKVPTPTSGLPPEDLDAFRELAPKLSPKGRELISLLVKVFNEKGEINTNQLLQMINNYTGLEKNSLQKNSQNQQLSPLISMLPLLASSLSNQQGINPTILASLLSMLASNRPQE